MTLIDDASVLYWCFGFQIINSAFSLFSLRILGCLTRFLFAVWLYNPEYNMIKADHVGNISHQLIYSTSSIYRVTGQIQALTIRSALSYCDMLESVTQIRFHPRYGTP